jgi:hypothetical protein
MANVIGYRSRHRSRLTIPQSLDQSLEQRRRKGNITNNGSQIISRTALNLIERPVIGPTSMLHFTEKGKLQSQNIKSMMRVGWK